MAAPWPGRQRTLTHSIGTFPNASQIMSQKAALQQDLTSAETTSVIQLRQRPAWLAGSQGRLQAHSVPAILPVLVFDGPHRVLGVVLVVGSRVQPQHDCGAAEDVLRLGAQHLLRNTMQRLTCIHECEEILLSVQVAAPVGLLVATMQDTPCG